MTITQKLGNRIKELREKAKLSQLALAQKAGLDLTTINEIENGNRDPMFKTLWKIANALGVKTDELISF